MIKFCLEMSTFIFFPKHNTNVIIFNIEIKSTYSDKISPILGYIYVCSRPIKLFGPSKQFNFYWNRRGRDRMVVGFTFTTTYAICAYHH